MNDAESTPQESEKSTEASPDIGSMQLMFLFKCLGVSILLGILFYWASEATFRPPAVDSESSLEWTGFTNELMGRTGAGREEIGPAAFVGQLTSELVRETGLDFENDTLVWILFCIICGTVFWLIRARSWRKRVIEQQAYDEPIVSQKLRTRLIRVALALVLVVVVFEFRNGMRRAEREANFQFLLASAKGNVSDVNHWLSEGASLRVRPWSMERFDPALGEDRWHKTEYIGPAGDASKEDAELFEEIREHNALHLAARGGHKEIVELLLSKGANVNEKVDNSGGVTALHYAAQEGHKEIVELLLSKGADVNAKTKNRKYTPLHLAVGRNTHLLREFRRALESISDSEAKAKLQAQLDAELKKLEQLNGLVELLIAQGAEVNAENVHGRTPLDMAVENELREIVELLRKHGGKTRKELREEGK